MVQRRQVRRSGSPFWIKASLFAFITPPHPPMSAANYLDWWVVKEAVEFAKYKFHIYSPVQRVLIPSLVCTGGNSAWQVCNSDGLASYQRQRFLPFALHVTDHRDTVDILHTVRSGLSLSRWLTARMTPDLHDHRAMSPISGGSSPPTQRNRFPTSSGRASTAMALRWSTPHPPSIKLPKYNAFTVLSFRTV